MSVPPERFPRIETAVFALAIALGGACGAPSRVSGDTGGGGTTGSGGSTGTAAAGTAGLGAGGAAGGGGSGGGRGGFGGAIGAAGQAGTSGTGGSAAGGTGAPSGGASGSGGRGGSGSGGSTGAGGANPPLIPGSGHCAAPSGANLADAQAAYAKWKSDLVVGDGARGFLRVQRPNSSGAQVDSTVSEGIGYGMLLAVYANDQNTFDQLWQYEQQFPDNHGLMNWYISADGTMALGTGAATDGDEDMAFALVMADQRWGGQGSLSQSYLASAKTLIGLIWQYEVDPNHGYVLTSGDQSDGSVINISYFAPAYYRAFGRVTGQTSNWNKVIDESYTVISNTLNAQNGNTQNGLVPAWSTPAGVPMTPPGTSMPLYHQLDSCRTPFRLGEDYCWNAEPRALAYLQKITGFYSGVGAANLVDGYDLNGTPHPQFVTAGGPRAASFVGPAGVGAMATGTTNTQLRDDAYAGVATLTELAGSTYYQESWTALSLQMMTGILHDLGQP
ncbi:MAG TPA: glycosyl hydrolase family 8 [Polyangia bacterium]|nr:glycosyl hydrolase family 8 [Polyangia bacterium]